MTAILIVDDEKNIREGLYKALKPGGFKIYLSENGTDGYQQYLANRIDLAILDIKMHGMDGLTLLKKMQETENCPPVIFLTGHGSVETAVEAMQLGAYDFLTKPVNLDKLELIIARALQQKNLEDTNRTLQDKVIGFETEKIILGRSKAVQDVIEKIKLCARSKANIFIYGESGTGKELVCDAVHYSISTPRPLIKVNCAALSPTLIESELFGHEKGSFTGAQEKKIGRFEAAHGGTIFLDEISEISIETQVKLLRVIQERKIERVGSNIPISVDFRIISASNKNIQEEIRQNRFREDLFYRLNVIDIYIPPLRERRGDIEYLARHFFDEFTAQNEKKDIEISSSVFAAFNKYSWPGNIRELKNVIEKMTVLAKGSKITSSDLPDALRTFRPEDTSIVIPMGTTMEECEKIIINAAVAHCNGNKSEAAKLLGIGRKTLHRKLSGEDRTDANIDN